MFCSHCKQDQKKVYKNNWCRECLRAYRQTHREQIAERKRAYYKAVSGMTDVLSAERELGIRRMSGTCQVCGKKITRANKYHSYCSYTCYRQAFKKYRRTA